MVALHEADGRGSKAGIEDIGQGIHCLEGQLVLLLGEWMEKIVRHQKICGIGVGDALRYEGTLSALYATSQRSTTMVMPVPQLVRDRKSLAAGWTRAIDRDNLFLLCILRLPVDILPTSRL
jgi:hypothetical protein